MARKSLITTTGRRLTLGREAKCSSKGSCNAFARGTLGELEKIRFSPMPHSPSFLRDLFFVIIIYSSCLICQRTGKTHIGGKQAAGIKIRSSVGRIPMRGHSLTNYTTKVKANCSFCY